MQKYLWNRFHMEKGYIYNSTLIQMKITTKYSQKPIENTMQCYIYLTNSLDTKKHINVVKDIEVRPTISQWLDAAGHYYGTGPNGNYRKNIYSIVMNGKDTRDGKIYFNADDYYYGDYL